MTDFAHIPFALKGVYKKYGHHQVIQDLSLQLEPGDIALLLGANGSGKSTLLRMCTGLLRPDTGAIEFNEDSKHIPFRKLAYYSHELMLYKRLTVKENLSLFLRLSKSNAVLSTLLARFKLTDLASRAVKDLSKGQQCRVSLSRAFMNGPEFLFLDEPSTALDEESLVLLGEQVKTCVHHGGVALIATHDLDRMLPLASKVFVLKNGKIAKKTSDNHREALEYYRQVNR